MTERLCAQAYLSQYLRRKPCVTVAIITTVSAMEQSTLDRKVADRIRERLRELEMSQAELARRLGLGVDAMSFRMRGKTAFKAAEIPRVAEVLGIPAAELLGEE